MPMNTRREVVKALITAVGGVSLLSRAGIAAAVTVSEGGKWRYFNPGEAALVSRLSDLLLPRTETPGALDVSVPGFIDGLMAQWADDITRTRQRDNLRQLEQLLDDAVSACFVEVSMAKAEQALANFDAKAYQSSDLYPGYKGLKVIISQSYFASEPGATEELKWVAVPGRWDPKVAI